ncbi:hypothetical protein JCM33374_g4226 [Metschnikowia sp. JCM 33374]|nr:hypothetical protein JCM33374_g4226 [Metschnikowia sp. JCM 33374]
MQLRSVLFRFAFVFFSLPLPSAFPNAIPRINKHDIEAFATAGENPQSVSLPYNETKDIEDLIRSFICRLKEFVSDTYFDVRQFETAMKPLGKDFDQITSLALRYTKRNAVLSRHLRFATDFFRVMELATDELKQYSDSGSIEESLVYRMVDLNVRVLGMFNSYGFLDREMEDYADKLFDFWAYMRRLKLHFRFLHHVPVCIQSVFAEEASQAEDIIEKLWTEVSESEY